MNNKGVNGRSNPLQTTVNKQPISTLEGRRGQQPVINTRSLKEYVKYQHFKMEGHLMIKDLLQKDDFRLNIDLKEAYCVMSISPKHRICLRFLWDNKNYQYTALPFGLGKPLAFSQKF